MSYVRPEVLILLDNFVDSFEELDAEQLREQELQEAFEDGYSQGEVDFEQSAWLVDACYDNDHHEFMNTEHYDDWLRERSDRAKLSAGIDIGDIAGRAEALE